MQGWGQLHCNCKSSMRLKRAFVKCTSRMHCSPHLFTVNTRVITRHAEITHTSAGDAPRHRSLAVVHGRYQVQANLALCSHSLRGEACLHPGPVNLCSASTSLVHVRASAHPRPAVCILDGSVACNNSTPSSACGSTAPVLRTGKPGATCRLAQYRAAPVGAIGWPCNPSRRRQDECEGHTRCLAVRAWARAE